MYSLLFAAAIGSGVQFRAHPVAEKLKLVGEAWPEADALFQRDPRWIGGDSAYSIDLCRGRVLWLFGDSFVATSPARSRREAAMVRNSIGIQSGYDVKRASVKFSWHEVGGKPMSFFDPPGKNRWYWPADGVKVGRRLILFLWEEKVSGGLGFAATGWQAIAVENPSVTPEKWSITKLAASSRFGVSMGSAVVVKDGYLYAYACGREHPEPTYLARWPLIDFSNNSPGKPEWFCGCAGWVREDALRGDPAPIADVHQSEFNVYPMARVAPYFLVQTDGFGAANLAYQTASSLTSGYSGRKVFYVPPEKSKARVMIYSGKMHPMLKCPGYPVVASYSTNSFDFETLLDDMTLYFPRFVRAHWVVQ
jgi:hypothetical protein